MNTDGHRRQPKDFLLNGGNAHIEKLQSNGVNASGKTGWHLAATRLQGPKDGGKSALAPALSTCKREYLESAGRRPRDAGSKQNPHRMQIIPGMGIATGLIGYIKPPWPLLPSNGPAFIFH